ncbi:DHA2 family efflux MFS transporter permease subunit [Sandaracinobacteroides hominis]|uniref:DHA2 family efflux MFS transporter permease subunit n=1 Tax=Sandaracinobacteroides hominis TaxID=2780086 RepID=UPI002E2E293A|nr:DHA2 family efflux MFS transporter permease subunit [Sandaracinobacteroides hominis]
MPLPDEERPALHTRNRPLLAFGVMAATIMQILDTTIANVAVPHMQAALGATADTITWVLTSYIIASAVALPLTGWLSDRFGSRNLFLVGVFGFVAASMLCGLATSLNQMVAFRLLQGVMGAFIMPLSQTVMMDINPKSRQASAMAIWGMGVMIGPILGPVIGGWLTEYYNWRWCFYVNVPIGIGCFAILWALLPTREQSIRRFDIFGFAMLAIALSSFQLMLDRGQTMDWFSSWEVRIEAIVMVSAAWMFGIHMATAREPMFDRHIFANRNLMMGMLFMAVNGMLMTATLALLPPLLQGLYGYPVLTTGVLLMPRGVGILISMFVTSRLIARGMDPRILVALGLIVAAQSLHQMSGWSPEMGSTPFIVSGLVQGLGMGLVFMPLNLLAFATLPPKYRTDGSSLLTLFRSIGGSAGISLVTVMLARNVQVNHMELGGKVTGYSISSVDPGMASALGSAGETVTAMLDAAVNQQALMIAYLDDFKLMMFLTLAALPLVMLLQRPPKQPAAGKDEDMHVAFD